eukprot:ANDGO_06025.mRNA.1 Guanosine nucleotide diphosphate dissociation inhibitor 1
MDEEYDAIVLGTGLSECVISGLLSVSGYKVLHVDRNNFYGGACASLNLQQLYQQVRGSEEKPPASLGLSREYYVDLVPKFIVSAGKLVRLLVYTKVTRYLEFVLVEGSFVYDKKGKVHKVPATDGEALKSPLMGLFEKRRCAKFLSFVADYDEANPSTQKYDAKMQMSELYKKFDLSEDTQQFIGHCIALHLNDDYLSEPALETIKRIQLYNDSLERFGTSPFLYVPYGLGELPQAFARLSAVYGGVYMLDRPVDEILFNEEGKACGIKSNGESARCKFIVGDPSYFQKYDKVRQTGKVVRCICILDHTVANTNDAKACQIIIPQKQVGRQNDIYISVISSEFKVAPAGKTVVILSTKVETANPEAELQAGFDLLGPIQEKFTVISDAYEPLDDGKKDACFISKTYDATSHLETTADDIISLWSRITGKDLDWEKLSVADAEQAQ